MKHQLADVERLLKALADSTRLRILGLLAGGEVCVCHIHETLRVTQPKASRHLAYLRRAGLVETRRQGVWIYYRLAQTSDPVLRTIQGTVTHVLSHLEPVRHDAVRLERKTGCCFPTAASQPTLSCCDGRTRSPSPADVHSA